MKTEFVHPTGARAHSRPRARQPPFGDGSVEVRLSDAAAYTVRHCRS
jgi:hypothetical protein